MRDLPARAGRQPPRRAAVRRRPAARAGQGLEREERRQIRRPPRLPLRPAGPPRGPRPPAGDRQRRRAEPRRAEHVAQDARGAAAGGAHRAGDGGPRLAAAHHPVAHAAGALRGRAGCGDAGRSPSGTACPRAAATWRPRWPAVRWPGCSSSAAGDGGVGPWVQLEALREGAASASASAVFDTAASLGDKEGKQRLPELLALAAGFYRDAVVAAVGAPELVVLGERADDIERLAAQARQRRRAAAPAPRPAGGARRRGGPAGQRQRGGGARAPHVRDAGLRAPGPAGSR